MAGYYGRKMPEIQVAFVWKELVQDAEGNSELHTPRGDPMEYEYPIDFLFETEEEAQEFLTEQIEPEEYANWVLCRRVIIPIRPTEEPWPGAFMGVSAMAGDDSCEETNASE